MLMLIGAAALTGAAILVIPVPKPSPNFSRTPAGELGGASSDAGLRDIRWQELMPEDWDPYQQATELQKGARVSLDDDPRAAGMLKKMRDLWDHAPVNPAMDGAAVRIPGYVVPLDESKRGVKEFLLVPYFGACIHSPPPPANQIVHVVLDKPSKEFRMMDAVWASGTLKTLRSDSAMGMSGYRMLAIGLEPYVPAPRP